MSLKNGKVFTSKFVGTRPSSYEKKNLPGRGLTNLEKHCTMLFDNEITFILNCIWLDKLKSLS
jgi:hypothetical protein